MTPEATLRYDFDFLYYQEDDAVIAHCLQTDTAASGKDIASAREALRAALELEIESAVADGDPQRVYATRAPDEYWDLAAGAERHLYLVEVFRIPDPQRVDLKEHVLPLVRRDRLPRIEAIARGCGSAAAVGGP